MEGLLADLASEPASDRRRRPGMEAERADVIVGGTVVLAELMRHFDFDTCLTSESDILDGLVATLLARLSAPSTMLPMVVTDRVLMGPGPCNPYPEATAGLVRPMLGSPRSGVHRHPRRDLRPAPHGMGHRQCADPACLGHRVGRHGGGVRQHRRSRRRGGDRRQRALRRAHVRRGRPVRRRVVRVEAPWGQPLDPDAVLSAHPSPKLVALVHAETSTGVRNDVAAVAAGKGRGPGAGGLRDLPRWHTCRHRRLGSGRGVQRDPEVFGSRTRAGPFSLGPRAWERRIETPRSWYLDLGMIGEYTTGATRRTTTPRPSP